MIKFENTDVVGWEHAIRGMRNPMNSWDRSDSGYSYDYSYDGGSEPQYCIGSNDYDLMMRLSNGGPVHAKYRRMIVVYVDITAPLYWWKEMDTYKVGTVANSCSTMHKIAEKEFTIDDFSHEHLGVAIPAELNDDVEVYQNLWEETLKMVIENLNYARKSYIREKEPNIKKQYWWQMIQLLPTSYNQKRTLMFNYEVLHNIYISRKDHKLDEWREMCKWIEGLRNAELIICKEG